MKSNVKLAQIKLYSMAISFCKKSTDLTITSAVNSLIHQTIPDLISLKPSSSGSEIRHCIRKFRTRYWACNETKSIFNLSLNETDLFIFMPLGERACEVIKHKDGWIIQSYEENGKYDLVIKEIL